MSVHYIFIFIMAISAAPWSFFVSADTQRQSYRAGKWESSLALTYADSGAISGEQGSNVDIDSGVGFGFSFGYHFSEKLLLNLTFDAVRQDYGALVVSDTPGEQDVLIQHHLDMITSQINGVYHFTNNAFTPFIQGGVGWTVLDSNIASSPGYIGCYWDPWYGYICDAFTNTYSDNSFSYNAGAGLRWELNFDAFIRVGYYHHWLDLDTPDSYDVGTARLEIGYSF